MLKGSLLDTVNLVGDNVRLNMHRIDSQFGEASQTTVLTMSAQM